MRKFSIFICVLSFLFAIFYGLFTLSMIYFARPLWLIACWILICMGMGGTHALCVSLAFRVRRDQKLEKEFLESLKNAEPFIIDFDKT